MEIKAENISFDTHYVFTGNPALIYFDEDRGCYYPIMYFRRPKGMPKDDFNKLIESIGFTIKRK